MEQHPSGYFLKYKHVLPQTNGAVFQVLSYLYPGTSYMNGEFVLVLKHKENKLLSNCRNSKRQDNFDNCIQPFNLF